MSRKTFWTISAVFFICIFLAFLLLPKKSKIKNTAKYSFTQKSNTWIPPDTSELAKDAAGNLIRYGHELIVHTSRYLGPKGSVAQISNGMNCDNCHINGGTTLFANNFSVTAPSYPQFKKRNNSLVDLVERIDGCFERSLNGEKLTDTSREMKAMIAYINWMGKNKDEVKNKFGTSTEKLAYLNRAADTANGKVIFLAQCSACHGQKGEGKLMDDGREYLYPPLWGKNSYNNGAGLYQLTNLAGFVKNNMPYGTTYKRPFLSDAQAWDVAAYVNSMPRPSFKSIDKDWPDISAKPIDYPFGPYADTFSENQHKFGPFGPIALADKNLKKNKEVVTKK